MKRSDPEKNPKDTQSRKEEKSRSQKRAGTIAHSFRSIAFLSQVLHQEVIFPNCVSREVVQSKRTRRGISSLIEPFSYWLLSDDEEGAALTTEAVHVVFGK